MSYPVSHSILSSKALLADVQRLYDLQPVKCRFFQFGLNDTYILDTAEAKYVLRVYRQGWRTTSDVLYELDLLNHVSAKGVRVSRPVPRTDGSLLAEIEAPEGLRQIVLFTFAKGKELSYKAEKAENKGNTAEKNAALYGQAIADFHNAVADFSSSHSRFRLDLNHIIEEPVRPIEPFLEQRPEDWSYLTALAESIRTKLEGLPLADLEWATCHGDFHGGNAHVDTDTNLTFFDFDCAGPGWRAYEISVFLWNMRYHCKDKANGLWTAFLQGYTEKRKLAQVDLRAVPLFIGARQIWLMGMQTAGGENWGTHWLGDTYFDRELKYLREWNNDYKEILDGLG